ncbi:hypothetical protein D9V30_08420 [Mycetocola reblochoni]|uniref:Gp28/Gp37-like domain-containing protein n=2 Tax=Mycetocola reblochoni TaxID=331618 RepID=A0A1R4JQD2_9MICO|nr:hypothetical protein [Mycetocola reblochoni]RLP69321.1 hypothetical protein D9V30_08420 [Mycetocola reblochoni]SJN34208.1 hypothetical protein FM119_08830 [Mycetocola reblochoni REB411]
MQRTNFYKDPMMSFDSTVPQPKPTVLVGTVGQVKDGNGPFGTMSFASLATMGQFNMTGLALFGGPLSAWLPAGVGAVTLSLYVRASIECEIRITTTASGNTMMTPFIVPQGEWTRLVVTISIGTSSAMAAYLEADPTSEAGPRRVEIAAVQLEEGSEATPFFAGDFSSSPMWQSSWLGEPGRSASVARIRDEVPTAPTYEVPAVEIRDRNRNRVGLLAGADSVTISPRKNTTGVWTAVLPARVLDDDGNEVLNRSAQLLAEDGAGIRTVLPGGRAVSGPVETRALDESTDDPGGTWTFTGCTDMHILEDDVAYPDPSNAAPGMQSKTKDYRKGAAETLMRAFVSDNIGPTAPTARRLTGLTLTLDQGRGGTVEGTGEWQSLLELLQGVGRVSGLVFDVFQNDDGQLVFAVDTPVDAAAHVRMSVYNGDLDSTSATSAAPAATEVLVLGPEDETTVRRTVIRRTTATSEAAATRWGRRRVRVIDARGSETATEMAQAGDEELADGGDTVTSVKVVPADGAAARAGIDWWLGSLVAVDVAGVEMVAEITEVNFMIAAEGVLVTATVGDSVGYDEAEVVAARLADLESRTSAVERTASATANAGTRLNNLEVRVSTLEAAESSRLAMAAGTVLVAPGTPTTVTVAYPAGRFSTTPSTVAGPATGVPQYVLVSVSNESATSFQIVLRRSGSTNTGVRWIAMERG